MANPPKDNQSQDGPKNPLPGENNKPDEVSSLDKTKEIASNGFIDTLHKEISGVLGGTNPNQYLCLTMPGTIINPEKFKYDTSGIKPAHVKANESKLANKLFDACFVSAGDNGKKLSNQYKTALSMLSPKMNRELFALKNRLRTVLRSPYPYDFGDGLVENMTVEQVFYRLYNDYVEEKSNWNRMQLDKKKELEMSIIDPVVRNDKYLEWYGTVAEAARVNLEEKHGRVLSVFSPNDMDIINAILNCGVGGEIEQARSTISMVEELDPDGGYIYPVNFTPDNWFDFLESSFSEVDLLESPAALSQKLLVLKKQRRGIMGQINNLLTVVPTDDEYKKLKDNYENANKNYTETLKKCVDTELGATVNIATAVVDMCMQDEKGEEKLPDEQSVARAVNHDEKADSKTKKIDVKALISKIGKNALACSTAQSNAVEAGAACTAKAIELCEANNRKQLKSLLVQLQSNQKELEEEIEEVQAKLQISRAVENKNAAKEDGETVVMPNKSDVHFTQLFIRTKMSALSTSSSKETEATSSRTSASFFFGGYSSSESHSKSVEKAMSENADMEIQIGMNVAKVEIEREWFNPGVFQLTDQMFIFSNNHIAPVSDVDFINGAEDEIKERFNAMNDSILPAYPVAFIIVKDVSIRFSSASGISASFAETVEDHASKGGGFLCFSSNSSKSNSSSQSAAVVNSNSHSVTVRFNAPQILGYYMQAVPADKSVHINDPDNNDLSIIGFISDFKLMMDDFVKGKNHLPVNEGSSL